MNRTITIRLPEPVLNGFDRIARSTERPRSFIIRKAMESYLEDQAELQRTLDRFRDFSDKVFSSKS